MLRLPGLGAEGEATGARLDCRVMRIKTPEILPTATQPSLFYFDQLFRQGFDIYRTALQSALALTGTAQLLPPF